MRVLERLTVANLKKNSRRTAVTIIGVTLATALILAVAGMVTSFQKMMIDFAIEGTGDYHDMYQEVPLDAVKYITNNNHVASYYFSAPLSTPAVDPEMLDFYEQYPDTVYDRADVQELAELPADADGPYNVFVRYDEPTKYEEFRANIAAVLEREAGKAINVRTNSDLLHYEAFVFGDAALRMLYSLAFIVIGIIVITSVFVIRNSFSISAAERQRQFGMLASIGATPKQIRSSVYFEGLVIGAIGIPLGILLGVIAVAVLVLVVNYLLDGMIPTGVKFSMPFWVFPFAIILSLLTIFLSSLLPAIRAGRLAPVEAIRGNHEIKVKARKLRTPKLVGKIFGIGGVIASKNLKRSRKKYRTTVVSIVLSVATFIGLASFLDYGKMMVGMKYSNSEIDLAMQSTALMTQSTDLDLYHELQSQFNLKDSVYYFYHQSRRNLPITVMEQTAFEDFAKRAGVNVKDYSRVAVLNDHVMVYREDGGLTTQRYTDLKDGDTYTATITPEPDLEYELDFEATKVTDQAPLGMEGNHHPNLYIPENYYLIDQLRYDLGYFSEFFAANVEDTKAVAEYAERYLKERDFVGLYSINDVEEITSQTRRMYLLICIFLYGFIIVVMLIGITNIFNTITTNIALRAKEFAMLKSIGMTKQEFDRMIRLESLMYSGKALLIGLPLGLLLSYAFYRSIAYVVDFGWSVPWLAILISILAVGILISVIMTYSVRQVEKQNIIETIRQDNI